MFQLGGGVQIRVLNKAARVLFLGKSNFNGKVSPNSVTLWHNPYATVAARPTYTQSNYGNHYTESSQDNIKNKYENLLYFTGDSYYNESKNYLCCRRDANANYTYLYINDAKGVTKVSGGLAGYPTMRPVIEYTEVS